MVAEFDYQPVACQKSYRMIVLRKRLGIDKGQMRLFEEYRYFFYITNDRKMTAEEVVFSANDRCDQENLIAQLKSGVHALTTPVDDLVSNWAYMVMGSLAWSLKAWSALLVPVSPRHRGEARGGETNVVADGVRDVLRGVHPDAVPDRAEWTTVDLPAAVVEPVARGLPPTGRAAARVLAVLKDRLTEVGVRIGGRVIEELVRGSRQVDFAHGHQEVAVAAKPGHVGPIEGDDETPWRLPRVTWFRAAALSSA